MSDMFQKNVQRRLHGSRPRAKLAALEVWSRRRKILALALVVAAAGLVTLGLTAAEDLFGDNGPDGETTGLIIKYKAGAGVKAERSIDRMHGAEVSDESEALRMKFVAVESGRADEAKAELQQDPNVEYVEEDAVALPAAIPNDPAYPTQYYWPLIGAEPVWDRVKGSVTIAIVDSGIAAGHPEFAGKIVSGYDFMNDVAGIPNDEFYHGTMVSGAAVAIANNGIGGVGACWECKIMPLRISGADGKGSVSRAIKAFQYAADRGVRIVNYSYSTPSYSKAEEDAVAYARGKGTIVIAAAGNHATAEKHYPASFPNALGVAGTDNQDKIFTTSTAGYGSAYGAHIPIAAPGAGILTAYNTDTTGNNNGTGNGTSMAAPIVAGVAGLLLSAFPNTTVDKLQTALTSTADTCCDGKIGGGRINAAKAYSYLSGSPINPTPTPTPPTPPPPTPPPSTPPPTPPVTPPTTPPPTPPGGVRSPDINGDGKVGVADLSVLLTRWKTADAKADLNANGTVDLTDLSMLLSNWSK